MDILREAVEIVACRRVAADNDTLRAGARRRGRTAAEVPAALPNELRVRHGRGARDARVQRAARVPMLHGAPRRVVAERNVLAVLAARDARALLRGAGRRILPCANSELRVPCHPRRARLRAEPICRGEERVLNAQRGGVSPLEDAKRHVVHRSDRGRVVVESRRVGTARRRERTAAVIDVGTRGVIGGARDGAARVARAAAAVVNRRRRVVVDRARVGAAGDVVRTRAGREDVRARVVVARDGRRAAGDRRDAAAIVNRCGREVVDGRRVGTTGDRVSTAAVGHRGGRVEVDR